MPDDAVVAFRPDARTVIVALTHDPKLDDMALMEALRSGASYVGAVGSARTSAERRKRLAEFDLTPQQVARLHGGEVTYSPGAGLSGSTFTLRLPRWGVGE
jgi:xanthine dehydrogenase accessory factor